MSTKTTRRRFLRNTTAAAAAPLILPSGIVRAADGRPAPSDRISIGMIGVGGMGSGHVGGFLNKSECQIVAVCDVDRAHNQNGRGKDINKGREPAKARVEAHYAKKKPRGYKGCDTYSDFRELCARKDIDAVVVATPDHWHALCALEALHNGKDVYCEKPVTHLFAEGQKLYKTVAEKKAIFQVGSQQRSDVRFRRAAEIVRNGILGKIKKVEIGLPTGHNKPDGNANLTEVPENLDYDFWCGPSKKLPFNGARNHWSWRWHSAFGAGQLMDWIGHHNDISNWALDLDVKGGPLTVEAVNWKMPDIDLYDTPVNYDVRSTYEGGLEVSLSNLNEDGSRRRNGIKWIGENGWVFVARGKLEASNREWIIEKFDRGPIKLYESKDHKANFLEGIRTRKECIAPARTGHRSITPGHIGWISYRTGRKLKWDDATESIVGDDAAEKMLKTVDYRGDWKLG